LVAGRETTFDYRGIISPPRDLDRWAALVRDFVRHLVARYGLAEVSLIEVAG
jgi:xylan 1,4-beta-xylosidase